MAVKNAEDWSCDKPVIEGKVSRNAKCNIVCPIGHDLVKGEPYFDSSIVGHIIYPISYIDYNWASGLFSTNSSAPFTIL